MPSAPRLKCQTCGKSFELSRKIPWCDCGGLFDLTFALPDRLDIDTGNFTLWRYGGILPVRTRIGLGEPITPIVQLNISGRLTDAKLEYLLPTGSFKDRGAAVLVSG